MQSFIVLGIIPGTNIQTTLGFWVIISVMLLVVLFRSKIIAIRNFVQFFMAIRKIARTINGFEFTRSA